MRRLLDRLYDSAAALAALSMVLCLAMVLASVAGRLLGFHLRGSDAYAGYAMAAAGFLALAHTLKRGEHIRVVLLIERLGARSRCIVERCAYLVGVFLGGVFAFYSARLVYQSWMFNDISQGNDATPLWLPQLAMAGGTAILFIALVDECALAWHGRTPPQTNDEPKRIE